MKNKSIHLSKGIFIIKVSMFFFFWLSQVTAVKCSGGENALWNFFKLHFKNSPPVRSYFDFSTTKSVLNVKDFGALGDGKTDDTVAIQKCFLEAGSAKYRSVFPGSFASVPEVVFPKGTYLISKTLLVPPSGGSSTGYSNVSIHGDHAVIKQISIGQDILYFKFAYANLVEGMIFDGGHRQIKIWTKNRDSAHFVIRNCVFKNSTGPAIDDQLRVAPEILRPDWSDSVLEPYSNLASEKELPQLEARDENQWKICGYVSTATRVTQCSFIHCAQAMSLWSDVAFVDSCKIETDKEMEGPAMIVGGTVTFENIEGIGASNPSKLQWWITLDARRTVYPAFGNANVCLKNSRFKTDSMTGWTVVRNEAKFTRGNREGCLTAIHAENCVFQKTNKNEPALFHLMEIPHQIVVIHCKEIDNAACNLFSFGQFFKKTYLNEAYLPTYFCSNNQNLSANFTEAMQAYVIPETGTHDLIANKIKLPDHLVSIEEIQNKITQSYDLKDFGAKGDGLTDEVEAFRKLISMIHSETNLVQINIPNGSYLVNDTIDLPPNVVLRGSGCVTISTSSNLQHPIFKSTNGGYLVLQNMNFLSCENALIVNSKNETKILVDNCWFNRINGYPVLCKSDSNHNLSEKNQLRISDCTFRFSKGFLNDFGYALCENSWITNDPEMKDSGAIVNHGTTHLKSLLTVPCTSTRYKSFSKTTIDTKNTDMRWIDNYQNLLIEYSRIGSESGGFPIVVHKSEQGNIAFRNSWINMCQRDPGNPNRNVFIDCESRPKNIQLIGNRGYPTTLLRIRKSSAVDSLNHFTPIANSLPNEIEELLLPASTPPND